MAKIILSGLNMVSWIIISTARPFNGFIFDCMLIGIIIFVMELKSYFTKENKHGEN